MIGVFFIVISSLAFRAYRTRPVSGKEGLIGKIGLVKETIDPEGLIFVRGEYWQATSTEKIEPGEKVEVEGADGLLLKIKRAVKEGP
jgi:membrane-bound serine protease (ClpP class)